LIEEVLGGFNPRESGWLGSMDEVLRTSIMVTLHREGDKNEN